MHHFAYRGGEMFAEDVPLNAIAEAVGTPFYCYSTATIERHYGVFCDAFADVPALVCYAVKANSNQGVLATLARLGAGMDVVSEGELRRARAAGVPAQKIIFSGVGKTRGEMAYGLDEDILCFNVESEPELEALSEVAVACGRRARIAVRVNPDVDARTHAKISTGKKENKFGIDLGHIGTVAKRATALPGIAFHGLAVHIGSQLTDLAPYRLAFAKLVELVGELRGTGIQIERLDLGGGLGIAYEGEAPPSLTDYAAIVKGAFGNLGVALAFEPGRLLVGDAGVLVAKVLYVKGTTRRFVVLDAAMNDLIRPALYEAWHEIVPVHQARRDAVLQPVDIVGPICETGDTFATQRKLPPVTSGDLVAILSAGAYGAAMSSTYNSRLLVPEVLVHGDQFAVIRPRPSYQDMLSQDAIPGWLAEPDRARGAA